jgi:hypothetical protein
MLRRWRGDSGRAGRATLTTRTGGAPGAAGRRRLDRRPRRPGRGRRRPKSCWSVGGRWRTPAAGSGCGPRRPRLPRCATSQVRPASGAPVVGGCAVGTGAGCGARWRHRHLAAVLGWVGDHGGWPSPSLPAGWAAPEGSLGVPAGMGVRPQRGPSQLRARPARCRQRCDLRRWVVGLPGLEPGTHPYQGSAPGLVSAGSRLGPGWMMDRWRPLGTARLRWDVDQTWTRPTTHSGPVGLDQAPWSGVVGPARPGRPTCGLTDGRACNHLGAQVDQFMAGARGRSRSMRHSSTTMSLPTVLPREPRGSNPAPWYVASRGRSRRWPATCNSRIPSMTTRARRGPAVPDAARTQRGPSHAVSQAALWTSASLIQRARTDRHARYSRASCGGPSGACSWATTFRMPP